MPLYILLAGLMALGLASCAHRSGDFTPAQNRATVQFLRGI